MQTVRISGRISLVICEKGKHCSDIEKAVSAVRKSVVLDLIELVSEVREIDEVILMTNHHDWLSQHRKWEQY